jgi:2,5-diketo-D-gluconate reductase A
VPGCNSSTAIGCYTSTAADIDADLFELGFRNVDLILLHFPPRPFPWRPAADCGRLRAQWRALEDAFKAGKARAIGVSNFCPSCFECLAAPGADAADPAATVVPAVNQVQLHVGMGAVLADPKGIAGYCAEKGVLLQAYSPLGDARSKDLISGPLVSAIGAEVGRSGVQIALKWVAQSGLALVTKSNTAQHLADDIDLFDWTLTPRQMRALNAARSPYANYSFACTE